MALEIERRFIARVDPRILKDAPHRPMRQGYITVRDPATVRIRQQGDDWVLAVKAEAEGIARHEIEVHVSPHDGETLLGLAIGGSVEKVRYDVGGWEIDVYEGRFAGLVLAEAELDHADEPLPPVPDGLVLVREITMEVGLSARRLAGMDETAARVLVERLTRPPG